MTDEQLLALTARARERAGTGATMTFVAEPPRALQVHALPVVTGTWEPPCMTCHEPIGYTAPEGRYRGTTECARCRAGSVEIRLATSGISSREIAEPLEALKPRGPDGVPYTHFAEWMTFLRQFAALAPGQKLEPPFAFACGTNGVGKSAGAQRAMRDAIRNGCQGRFLTLGELLRSIYATYGENGKLDESTEDRVTFYSTVHLLIVDEVGIEASASALQLFFDIVDARWRDKRPTIFTANYLPTEESLGNRVTSRNGDSVTMRGLMDRLRGGAEVNLFTIRGKSWRGHENRT